MENNLKVATEMILKDSMSFDLSFPNSKYYTQTTLVFEQIEGLVYFSIHNFFSFNWLNTKGDAKTVLAAWKSKIEVYCSRL